MSELTGLCHICGKIAKHSCKMCGKMVCDAHYNKKTGLCESCRRGRIV